MGGEIVSILLISLMAVSILTQGIPAKEKTQKVAAITIGVYPQVALVNPYKSVVFRVLFRIPEHEQNRLWSYAATCGAEERLSQHPVDTVSVTIYEELVVLGPCIFQACVHRADTTNHCAFVEVHVSQPP